ncbi:uncharacterized protein LOC110724098 [Chenopodium quinoa]|uniref:uncharacterized protein LOC110724098 n=1 Tax=Chenopodium quinoa TaxID=63459 RepID=UPI000B799BB6|nr:uncharacterized protein LOC110724098 [Chenopodium quinoa]
MRECNLKSGSRGTKDKISREIFLFQIVFGRRVNRRLEAINDGNNRVHNSVHSILNNIRNKFAPKIKSAGKSSFFGATNISCKLIPNIVKDGVNTVVNPVISIVDGLQPAIYTPPKDDLKKEDFPADFIFGASTSALQTEGRGDEGGRGKSTWDFMIEAEKGRKAVDSYNLYKEDVRILKETGLNRANIYILFLFFLFVEISKRENRNFAPE